MLRYQQNTMTGCTASLVTKRRVRATGRAGTARPRSSFVSADCCTTRTHTPVTGRTTWRGVRNTLYVTMMQMATCHWASHAIVTGSVRADTLGCSAALPCWCLIADHWGVLCHPLKTARCLQHSHPRQRRWSKKGSRTSLTPDPTCPQELYLFLSGTGPGTNPDFTDRSAFVVTLYGAKHQRSAWRLSKDYK